MLDDAELFEKLGLDDGKRRHVAKYTALGFVKCESCGGHAPNAEDELLTWLESECKPTGTP